MNCDFCTVPISEDETFIVLPQDVSEPTSAGFVPRHLRQLAEASADRLPSTSKDEALHEVGARWQQLVADNSATDWLLCPDCHWELVQFRKNQT